MKNYLKTLIALLLAMACVFAFASCKIGGGEGEGEGEGEGTNETPGTGGSDDGQTVLPPADEDDGDDYRIRFVYSYTAKIVNNNGRTENKKEIKTVHSEYISLEDAANGYTDELKAKFAALEYHGYTFDKWYTEWDTETQTGVEGTEFTYPAGPITSDITLYGYREAKAGPNATYTITYEYVDENGEVALTSPTPIVTEDEDEETEATSADTNTEGETTEGENGETPAEPVLTLSNVILTISGEGKMFDFANANEIDVPWYKQVNEITKIVIEDGITAIGSNSFGNFIKVKSVTLANTVTTIGASAFYGCTNTNWRELVLPASVKTVAANAFGSTKLRDVVLNDGLEKLSENAFYGSNAIRTIVVPTSLKEIGIAAFHPGGVGSNINTHALASGKVYYKGTPEQFESMKILMDNQWFDTLSTIYYYTDDAEVGSDTSSGIAYWHYAEIDGEKTDIPAQYTYAIKYSLEGAKVPFATFYVLANVKTQVKVDEDGNPVIDEETGEPVLEPVYDDNDVAVLEGVIDQSLVYNEALLEYHGYKFAEFSNGGLASVFASESPVITADMSITAKRGNILSEGGGVTWEYDKTTGALTISVNPDAKDALIEKLAPILEAGAMTQEAYDTAISNVYRIWDSKSLDDTGSMWTGDIDTLINIKTLTIAEGVEYIGYLTFAGLTSITEVVLPESLVGINENAFYNCPELISVYYNDAELAESSALKLNEEAAIYTKVEAATAENGNYWLVQDDRKIAWSLADNVLNIGGDADMIDFASADLAPWYGAKDNITTVNFANNITSLGENVINGYANVTSVSLSAKLRAIPESALAGTGIVNNTEAYTNGVLIINGHLIKVDAATRNTELFETTLGTLTIAEGAFDGLNNIKRLFIIGTLQSINPGAFDEELDLECIYVDGTEVSWTHTSSGVEFGMSDPTVYYKSDSKPSTDGNWYYKNGNDYVLWGCPHIFGDWVIHEGDEPTCVAEGTETRHCIYDPSHTETRAVAVDPDAHEWLTEGDRVTFETANCQHGNLSGYVCRYYYGSGSNKCKVILDTEEYPIIDDGKKLEHKFTNYVVNEGVDCLDDAHMTASCDYGCGTTDSKAAEAHSYKEDDPTTDEHEHYIICEDEECTSCHEATCTEDAVGHKVCDVCDDVSEAVTIEGSKGHTFENKVADEYKAEADNTYYKSCSICGEKSEETFVVEPETAE